MNLIACPACGKNISTQAKACPHCGAPTPRRSHRNKIIILIALLIVAAFLFNWLLTSNAIEAHDFRKMVGLE